MKETTPCILCGTATDKLGTKLCNACWELDRRIRMDPETAAHILQSTGYIVVKPKSVATPGPIPDPDPMEIDEMVQNAYINQGGVAEVLRILERITGCLSAIRVRNQELLKQIEEIRKTVNRSSNVVSCLANGIQPD